jgi:hypothetical protein
MSKVKDDPDTYFEKTLTKIKLNSIVNYFEYRKKVLID